MKGLRTPGKGPGRNHRRAWWDNYLIALAGLLLAGGLAFAALTAASAHAYPLAIALAAVAILFAAPTILQVVTELVVYLKIVFGALLLVLLLPALAVNPAIRRRVRHWWANH